VEVFDAEEVPVLVAEPLTEPVAVFETLTDAVTLALAERDKEGDEPEGDRLQHTVGGPMTAL
jgi:hypothetical protein